MVICHVPFLGHLIVDLVFRKIVSGISFVLLEIGILNLVCACILG